MIGVIVAALIGYLLGAIPFGLLLARFGGYGDVRRIGSGSIGATNVLRTGNKGLAALTLVFDLAKGSAAALIGARWSAEAMLAASAAVVIGHMFPMWLGFRGGKGVATGLGVVIAIAWPVAVLGLAVWLGVAVLTRYSSLASLVAVTSAAVYAGFTVEAGRAVLIAAVAVLIILRHHENIRRLIGGTESRISLKKS
jgi:acyl phosphate:glycerol-3-phosphate acyltransferase